MKGRTLSVTAILGIAIGVALIFAYRSIYSTGVVVAGGVIFIIAGILNIFLFDLARKDKESNVRAVSSTFSLVASIGAVILGICMIVFKDTFALLVPYIFGIIVAFTAIYQFYILAIAIRPYSLPAWFYLAPVLILAAAIYIFFLKPHTEDSTIILASGISIAFFGLITLIEAITLGDKRHKAIKAADKTTELKPLDNEAGTTTPKSE